VSDLTVNGAFYGQRVTGQQRYATEVAERLARRESVRVLRPSPPVARHSLLSHAWAHTVLPVATARGAVVSLTSRSPLIARRHTVVVHDLFVLRHPEWYSPRYARTHAPLLAAQLRTAAGIVAVSAPVADEIRRLHPRKAVTVAPNAPSDVFRGASGADLPPAIRRLTDTPGVEGFLFAVGSQDPRKNFAGLVNAYQLLPQSLRAAHPLVIAGGDSTVFAEHALHASPDVHRIGYVSDPALAALYLCATGVIVPSLDEGFGLPVVEALTAGGRLAVSDIPVFRWVAGDAVRYFDPAKPDSIARAVERMIEDPPGPADAATVMSRFDWQSTSDIIADFATGLR
jgi:glycosyltransferase involved in cell wall biosynthesis